MGDKMSKLILLRHGQSEWNKKNLFTGWIDIPLSLEGIAEAICAGKKLEDINIDVIYISCLARSEMTAFLVMAHHKSGKIPFLEHGLNEPLGTWYQVGLQDVPHLIPMRKAWELNERMYGSLQGKDKQQVMDQYGVEQWKLWRRSYDVCPPEGESLQKTAERAIPFFEKVICKDLEEGKDVFVCAHGNSLRAIIMNMNKLSKEEVLHLEIATGDPLIYEYKGGAFSKLTL